MRPNWGMLLVLLIGILFWTSVWYNGLFITTTWLIVISALIGIILKVSENRY